MSKIHIVGDDENIETEIEPYENERGYKNDLQQWIITIKLHSKLLSRLNDLEKRIEDLEKKR